MPVVTFSRPDLCRLIGKEVDMDVLLERMPMMGGDLDGVADQDITIEWFPDRPDLLMLEGTGRALRAFLGESTGLPEYPVTQGKHALMVDPSVAKVRPYAGLCFVRGLTIDDAYLQTIIDAQEKITLAPGRKRKKIAIGIHDARGIEGPFTYTCVGPTDKPFEPLAWEGQLTPQQIMQEHPKGQEYGHLLGDDLFPVFLDGKGDVLSLPPVINAAKTTVTTATTDLLIDVTGTDAQSVRHTIALLAGGFAEAGGTIESVTVTDASGTWSCPDLAPVERTLHEDDVVKLLGIPMSGDDIAAALEKMGHGAQAFGNQVLVKTPAWRFDILHPVDLMEDVAIGYGFENFPGVLPDTLTFGDALPMQDLEDKARSLLLGHGWLEARTLTLSNAHDQWLAWGEPARPSVEVRNPVLEEQTLLRTWLVPGLLHVLAANRHRPLPQRLFEVGYAVEQEGAAWKNRLRLGVVEQAAKASFSDIKALVQAMLRDLAIEAELKPSNHPGLIGGRQGAVYVGGTAIGWFGELHPNTITEFGLAAATVALELDLEAVHGRND